MTRWQDHAACHDTPTTVFFAEDPATVTAHLAQAMRVCIGCPVRTQCLQAALTEEGRARRRHRHGVRGGTTPGQRWRTAQQLREETVR